MSTSQVPRAPLNLGLIGCGQIARLHAQRIQADGRGQLASLFDPNLDNAARIQAEFAPAAKIFSSFDDLIQSVNDGNKIDAVLICTPTHRHFEDVRACREQGWPVLCEKPLADTRERIEQLISEVQVGGPLLSVAYQRRYQAPYRTLRREIQSGKWGRVLSIASHNCEHWEQFQALPGTWRDDPRQNPGGYLGDAGSHKLDILFFITGLLPTEVFAHSSKSQRHVEIVTMVSAKLEHGVLLGMTFLGNAQHFAEYLHIVCERADFKLIDNNLYSGVAGALDLVTDLEPEANPVTEFLDNLLLGTPNTAPAECARPVFQFTSGVLESAATGRVVCLN
jgi:predicted dehydrogenase